MAFFSEMHCACGCQNLLPRTIADRGWRFLRGHKPKGVAAARQTQKVRAPAPGPVSSVTPERVMEFLRAQLALTIEARREAEAELERLEAVHQRLADEANQLAKACGAMESFLRGTAPAAVVVEDAKL